MTDFNVSASIFLKDNFSKRLREISKSLTAFKNKIKEVEKILNSAMGGETLVKATKTLKESLSNLNPVLTLSSKKLNAFSESALRLDKSSESLLRTASAAKILDISLRRLSGISLSGISGLGLREKAVRTQRISERGHMGGTMPLIGAGVVAYGLKDLLQPSMDYSNENIGLSMYGWSPQQRQDAIKTAWSLNKTSPANALKELVDVKNILGNYQEAKSVLRGLINLAQFLQAGGLNEPQHEIVYSLLKAIDVKGTALQNPQEMLKEAGMEARAIAYFRGRINATQYQQLIKYSRQAGPAYSNDFLFKDLPSFIAENASGKGGGSHGGFGAVLAALNRNLVMGLMTKATATRLESLGLIPKNAIFKTTTTGVQLKPNSHVAHYKLLETNPFKWSVQVLLPALVKGFGSKVLHNDVALTSAINSLRLNQNASYALAQFLIKRTNVIRDRTGIDIMPNNLKLESISQNSPTVITQQFSQAWQKLLISIGTNILPIVLPAIKGLTSAFNMLGNFLHAHPTIAKNLAEIVVAITGGVVGGGIVFALSLLGTTIGGVTAGITAAIYGLEKAYDWIKSLMTWGKHTSGLNPEQVIPIMGAPMALGQQQMVSDSVHHTHHIYLNNQQVAAHVISHANQVLSSPPRTTTYVDPTMSLTPIGLP